MATAQKTTDKTKTYFSKKPEREIIMVPRERVATVGGDFVFTKRRVINFDAEGFYRTDKQDEQECIEAKRYFKDGDIYIIAKDVEEAIREDVRKAAPKVATFGDHKCQCGESFPTSIKLQLHLQDCVKNKPEVWDNKE